MIINTHIPHRYAVLQSNNDLFLVQYVPDQRQRCITPRFQVSPAPVGISGQKHCWDCRSCRCFPLWVLSCQRHTHTLVPGTSSTPASPCLFHHHTSIWSWSSCRVLKQQRQPGLSAVCIPTPHEALGLLLYILNNLPWALLMGKLGPCDRTKSGPRTNCAHIHVLWSNDHPWARRNALSPAL